MYKTTESVENYGGVRSSEQTNLTRSENSYKAVAGVMNRDNLSACLGQNKSKTEHSWIHLFPNNFKVHVLYLIVILLRY